MYNITFTLGDPGGDGHANTSEYHMVSNYSSKNIDDAYRKAVDIIGFDFVKKVGADWEDSSISEPYFSILVDKGILNRKDFEYEWKGKIEFDPYIDEEIYIDTFIKLIKLVLPDFELKFRDLKEESLTVLEGAAYGIAYHGE